jgi:hypothetical protein
VALEQVLVALEQDPELAALVQVEQVAEQDLAQLLVEQLVQVAELVHQVLVLELAQVLDRAVVLQLLRDNSFKNIKRGLLDSAGFFYTLKF